VAGSVEEVKTFLPKMLASQNVNRKSASSLRENSRINSNHTLENQSEGPLLEFSWRAEVEGTGGVSCSIKVLAARVTEVDGGGVNDRAATLLWLVVDNGTVRAGRRNRVK
jgi:hypothetical protein